MKKVLIIFLIFVIAGSVVLFPKDIDEIKKEIKKIIENKKEEPTKIMFVGDMMFDRGVRNKISQKGVDSLFENIQSLFEENDLIVGNLEETITNNKTIATPNSEILRFTFDPQIANLLKQNNFGLVSLANNHSLDFGELGYEETKNNLNNVGVLYFGSGHNKTDLSKKIILNNKNFCFVAYHDLYTKNEAPVIEEIKKIKNDCYKIIVFPHWGEEYLNSFTERQKKLAYAFVDSGADLIIGTHPHVIEPVEIYKDKVIFYSIGNFVFDQYFSFETSHSIALNVLFKEKEIEFSFVPVEIKSGIVTFADEISVQKILSALVTEDHTEKQKKDILQNLRLVIQE